LDVESGRHARRGDRSQDRRAHRRLRSAARRLRRAGLTETVRGHCLCGAVEIEIGVPAFWAWHDHSEASPRAHGAAYATYVGCGRKNVRIVKGKRTLSRFEDSKTNSTRTFCSACGTPVLYERGRVPRMVDVPRALLSGRTGREPRYHLHIEEMRDWIYTG